MDALQRFQAYVCEHAWDAAYIRDTPNIEYLTGLKGVFDEERAHALLVGTDYALLHTDSRYANACKAAVGQLGKDAVSIDAEALAHPKWLVGQFSQGVLAIEDSLTLAEFHKLDEELPESVKFQETTDVVLKLRSVKSAQEVACLRAAQAITDAAFAHICTFITPGVTEREVQRELDNFMLSHGASSLAFPTIVATGANGANPHAQPTEAKLEAGQCVVLDFGARAQGYCSDMTRTVFLGAPTAQLSCAYKVLREANETVEAKLQSGITGADAHNIALGVLDAGGFSGRMGHGLGHGVGIEIHELPVLSPRNSEPLQVGNVVTVEPGIYVPGEFGMRLEDFGIIAEAGFEVFTQSTHNMVVL